MIVSLLQQNVGDTREKKQQQARACVCSLFLQYIVIEKIFLDDLLTDDNNESTIIITII